MLRKLAFAALALAGCSVGHVGSESAAIIGGTNDTSDDPSVVMIYAQVGTGATASGAICTGEVVSPHMVLTAAHCVDPDVLGDVQGFVIYLGDNVNSDMEVAVPGNVRAVLSTDWDHAFDKNNLEGGHDIGEVTTKSPLPLSLLPVHQTPLTDSDVGSAIHLVGYGIDSGSDSSGASAGQKRETDSHITEVDGNVFKYGTKTHTTCEGDSGGPALMMIGGVQTIVGTVSYSTQGCIGDWTDTDVGSYYDSFIAPHITSSEAEAAAQDMLPEPAGDMAITPSGEDLASNASGNDDASTTSSGGLTLGASCQTSSQCASGVCTEGSAHYCTQPCELNVDTSCPSSMQCKDVGPSPFCVLPTKASGCSAATGSAPGTGGALGGIALLLAFALGLRFRFVSFRPRRL